MGEPPRFSDIEWLDAGPPDPEPDTPVPAGPSRRTLVIGAVALLAVAATIAAVAGTKDKHAPRAAAPSPTLSSTTPARAPAVSVPRPSPTPPPVTRTEAAHLLGVTDPWELVVRGRAYLTRINFATGRVVTTPVPESDQLDAPATLLVTARAALVLPMDGSSGYLVRDGRSARPLDAQLTSGGTQVFPGPTEGTFWIPDYNGLTTSTLVDVRGVAVTPATSIQLPLTILSPPSSDGSGYLIVRGIGGEYEARPSGLRRITTGAVLATGPRTYLAQECDATYTCALFTIDKASGARRRLPLGAEQFQPYSPGSISPDGRYAAVVEYNYGNTDAAPSDTVVLVDLMTGTRRKAQVTPNSQAGGTSLVAWSPDASMLFIVDDQGRLNAVNPATGTVKRLSIVRGALQIALRPAS